MIKKIKMMNSTFLIILFIVICLFAGLTITGSLMFDKNMRLSIGLWTLVICGLIALVFFAYFVEIVATGHEATEHEATEHEATEHEATEHYDLDLDLEIEAIERAAPPRLPIRPEVENIYDFNDWIRPVFVPVVDPNTGELSLFDKNGHTEEQIFYLDLDELSKITLNYDEKYGPTGNPMRKHADQD